MTKDLLATFGKSDGSTHVWTYKGLDPDLPVPKIKEACELLTKLDICTQNGVKLFDSVVTAKVLTHIETVMFDPETETKNVTYYGKASKKARVTEVQCSEAADKLETTTPTAVSTVSEKTVVPTKTYGRYFKQLTTIELGGKPDIKGPKDVLPQAKNPSIEKIKQQPDSTPLPESDLNQDIKERNRLLQWLQRIREKNKAGPATPKRE